MATKESVMNNYVRSRSDGIRRKCVFVFDRHNDAAWPPW